MINIELITIITVLLSLFPVESNSVIIGKAFFLFGVWGGEFGEIIQTGNVETSVQLWLVWGKLRLHQLNRGGEETRQKGKVSNVEDRNFDYEKEGLITTQKYLKWSLTPWSSGTTQESALIGIIDLEFVLGSGFGVVGTHISIYLKRKWNVIFLAIFCKFFSLIRNSLDYLLNNRPSYRRIYYCQYLNKRPHHLDYLLCVCVDYGPNVKKNRIIRLCRKLKDPLSLSLSLYSIFAHFFSLEDKTPNGWSPFFRKKRRIDSFDFSWENITWRPLIRPLLKLFSLPQMSLTSIALFDNRYRKKIKKISFFNSTWPKSVSLRVCYLCSLSLKCGLI